MSSGRSLLSLGLQKEVLAALTRNGYENLRDLVSVTVEELAKGKQRHTPNQLGRSQKSKPFFRHQHPNSRCPSSYQPMPNATNTLFDTFHDTICCSHSPTFP